MSRTMSIVNEKAGEYLRTADRGVIPESFLAALTANESLGDAGAKRFEPGVLSRLVSVILGQRRSYNGVTAGMLWLPPDPATKSQEKYALDQIQHLQDAATSWGFTQIMGYHMLRWDREIALLVDPSRHYEFTLKLLSECTEVDLSKDFEKMGRWWNTGKVDGKTYHESYIPNILRRMTQWAQIHPE